VLALPKGRQSQITIAEPLTPAKVDLWKLN
jgi:hypothetical protein